MIQATESTRVLLIGYGNPSRGDDGLGPAFIFRIADQLPTGSVTFEQDYQLNLEHVDLIAQHEIVIFIDADASCDDSYQFQKLEPKADLSFTTHSVSPSALLAMADEYFNPVTRQGYTLGIRGEVFGDFEEGLSPRAEMNLTSALDFLTEQLQTPTNKQRGDSPRVHTKQPMAAGPPRHTTTCPQAF